MRGYLFAGLTVFFLAGLAVISISATKNPHGKLRWVCEDCHTAKSWSKLAQPMKFSHNETGFVLVGAHKSAACIGCHKALVFSQVATACVDCHTDVHKGQLGVACQNCHTTENWKNRQDVLTLHAQKGFPLTGVHAVADCEACHRGQAREEFANTSSDCYSCHQSQFVAAKNPDHIKAGFDHDCAPCHTSNSWTPANYDHSRTGFVLTGAHRTVACISCHATSFSGTPTDCYSCHQGDYASTTNPSHAATGFSTDCQTCHMTSAWAQSNWDHDTPYFPIKSGVHQGKWTTCADCHVNRAVFAIFECINCHAHRKSLMDSAHVVVPGYLYVSQACFNCHPRGMR